jgi:hypothetical protein
VQETSLPQKQGGICVDIWRPRPKVPNGQRRIPMYAWKWGTNEAERYKQTFSSPISSAISIFAPSTVPCVQVKITKTICFALSLTQKKTSVQTELYMHWYISSSNNVDMKNSYLHVRRARSLSSSCRNMLTYIALWPMLSKATI